MDEQNKNEQNPNSEKSNTVDMAAVLKDLGDKLSNIEKNVDSKLETLKSTQVANNMQQENNEDLSTLIYSDPEKVIEKITKKVEAQVESRLNNQSQAQQTFNDTYLKLAQDYPEIADQRTKMHQRAKELLVELSKGNANDSGALERAVFRAATELGVMSVKHRKNEEQFDDDSYTGGSSNMSSRRKSREDKDEELDEKTLAFAQLVGKDIKDKAYLERLKKIQKERKGNWNKYK